MIRQLRKIGSCRSTIEHFTPNPRAQYRPITLMNDRYWQLKTLIGTSNHFSPSA